MLTIRGPTGYRRIVVINPKGGSGKSTLSVNLSGYLAVTNRKVAIVDLDPQGSSSHWLEKRPVESPTIHGAFVNTKPGECINLSVSLPEDTDIVVIDTPATLTKNEIEDITLGCHAIIIPIMPSELDIHSASGLIANLRLIARFSQKNTRLGIVANRVKGRTIALLHLLSFLKGLTVPMIGMIRDTQNYASTVREGISIHEMQISRVAKDLKTWVPITRWLEATLVAPLSEHDLLLKPRQEMPAPTRSLNWSHIMATSLILITITALTLHFVSGPVEALNSGNIPTVISSDQAKPLHGVAKTPDSYESKSLDGSNQTLAKLWQLSSVVTHSNGDQIVTLLNSSDASILILSSGQEIDGWRVKQAGRDFAVLTRNDKEVRLKIDPKKRPEN